jgi:hypothetical protein
MDAVVIARSIRQDLAESARRRIARYYLWSCAGMVVAMAGYATVAMLNANTAMAVGGMVTSGLFAVAAGLFHLRS